MRGLLLLLCACGPTARLHDAGPVDTATADAPTCALSPSAGCGAGETCDLDPQDYLRGGTRCRPAGDATEADECRGNDCAAGYTCMRGGDGFSCVAFCRDDGDCVGDGSRCALQVTFDDGQNPNAPVPGGSVCSQACDPLGARGCPPDWACRVARDAQPYTFCQTAGKQAQGGPCAGEVDCAAGFVCVGDACARLCEVTTAGACADLAGTACIAFAVHPVLGGREIGVCHD
jgi:hypothetical protein